jgi:membrane-associated phospholipid phosphatase
MRADSNSRTRRICWTVLVGVVGMLAFSLDHWAYAHLHAESISTTDLGRLLRIVGFWPTWGVAALALWFHDRPLREFGSRRAVLLAMTPAVSGMVAEVVKLLVRRERPGLHAGLYAFRAFADRPFSTVGLGMPSSHAAVAFGAAATLARLSPRTRWVWLALAVGCGVSRVLARAHFVTDVLIGATLGCLTGAYLWRWCAEAPI